MTTRESKIIEITKAIQAAVPDLRMAKYGSTVRDKAIGTGTVLDYIARSESIGRGFCKARVCWHALALVHNEVIDELQEDEDFPFVVPNIGIREILLWFKHNYSEPNLSLVNTAGVERALELYNLHKDTLDQQSDEVIDFLFTFTQS